MKEVIFASRNSGKMKEVSEIFQASGIKIISLKDLNDTEHIEENGLTFEDNAKIKAKAVYYKYLRPVISDDSGIAVKQLNWMPGVYSARFAGVNATDEDNNRKLIDSIKEYPQPHIAKYVCFAVFYNGSQYLIEYGEIYGTIIIKGRGHNGFGYDPYFIPDGYKKTMAELEPDEKNRISHRAIAFKKLRMKMIERL